MKKIFAWPVVWFLYYFGCFFSIFLWWNFFAFMYPAYNNFMAWSLQVQDWAGLKSPWMKAKPEDV